MKIGEIRVYRYSCGMNKTPAERLAKHYMESRWPRQLRLYALASLLVAVGGVLFIALDGVLERL